MTTATPDVRDREGQWPSWWHYHGDGIPAVEQGRTVLPDPPPWRTFAGEPVQPPPQDGDEEISRKLGRADVSPPRRADQREGDMVNAAIRLRRPLLVTGRPGSGKSAIAFRVARELRLGRLLLPRRRLQLPLRRACGQPRASQTERSGVADAWKDVNQSKPRFPFGA